VEGREEEGGGEKERERERERERKLNVICGLESSALTIQ
jgi:hypothetical protein